MAKKALLKRVLNCLPSCDTQNDWGIDSSQEVGVLAAAGIQASNDLRESWSDPDTS